MHSGSACDNGNQPAFFLLKVLLDERPRYPSLVIAASIFRRFSEDT